MNSCLYECRVMHHRFSPKVHRFVYRIFMLAIDLDEIDALHRRLRLFSVNRPNLFSFRERDYLPATGVHNPSPPLSSPRNDHIPLPAPSPLPLRAPAGICHVLRDNPLNHARPHRPRAGDNLPAATSPLKTRIIAHLAGRGIDLDHDARVLLVTLPRMLGYLFKPVSFYFCYDRAGHPVAALAEVTNTFHELKPYTLGPDCLAHSRNNASTSAAPGSGQPESTSAPFRLRVPKHFYVSPFSDVDIAFDFTLHPPDERFAVQIDDYDGPRRTLATTLTGGRRPLTDAALASSFFKYPLLTLRVITLIHWHALRLWLKRIPWFPKAARPADQRDLHHPHTSLTAHAPSPAQPPRTAFRAETPESNCHVLRDIPSHPPALPTTPLLSKHVT